MPQVATKAYSGLQPPNQLQRQDFGSSLGSRQRKRPKKANKAHRDSKCDKYQTTHNHAFVFENAQKNTPDWEIVFSWRKHMLIMPSACEYRIHSSSARFASLLPNGSSLKWGPRDQPFSYLKSTKNETLCTADEIMIIIIYYHIYQMLAGNLH